MSYPKDAEQTEELAKAATGMVVCELADGSTIHTTLSACQNTPGARVVSKLPPAPAIPSPAEEGAGVAARQPTDHVICRLPDGSEIVTTLSACQNTPGAIVVGQADPKPAPQSPQ